MGHQRNRRASLSLSLVHLSGGGGDAGRRGLERDAVHKVRPRRIDPVLLLLQHLAELGVFEQAGLQRLPHRVDVLRELAHRLVARVDGPAVGELRLAVPLVRLLAARKQVHELLDRPLLALDRPPGLAQLVLCRVGVDQSLGRGPKLVHHQRVHRLEPGQLLLCLQRQALHKLCDPAAHLPAAMLLRCWWRREERGMVVLKRAPLVRLWHHRDTYACMRWGRLF